MRWYAVYERQTVEEAIVNDHLYPPNGQQRKQVPDPILMRKLVDERLRERREAMRDGG